VMTIKDPAIKLYEETLNDFKKKYDEHLKDINVSYKTLDVVLKDIEQTNNWRKLSRIVKGKSPSLLRKMSEATFELVESVKKDCESLQHNYEELNFIRNQILSESQQSDLNDSLEKYVSLMVQYFDIYEDYKYILLVKATNVFEKAKFLWSFFTWKSNIILSRNLHYLTWVIAILAIVTALIALFN